MIDQQGPWPSAQPPSGLFPGPARPVYREVHRVTAAGVLSGLGGALLWFVLFGAIGRDLVSYAWWTIVAAVTAWSVSVLLAIFGDRGVAVGVALTSSIAVSVAACFVAGRWMSSGDWPLW